MGEVAEVVIPLKRNKYDKRFGFARFKGVVDERSLAVKQDNIMIDGKKIYANQPRFSRLESKGSGEVKMPHKGVQRPEVE